MTQELDTKLLARAQKYDRLWSSQLATRTKPYSRLKPLLQLRNEAWHKWRATRPHPKPTKSLDAKLNDLIVFTRNLIHEYSLTDDDPVAIKEFYTNELNELLKG